MEPSPRHALIRRPPPSACLGAIARPELYRNFAIHLFVMFPAAVLMCGIGRGVDARLGVDPLLTGPPALALGITLIASGALWVWYVYGYLYLSGGGSPGTHVDGGPGTMVDTGPYTVVRHPSVVGKLAGVVGLGIAWPSTTFLIGFVPVLVVYSVVTNRWLQERFCDARFGVRYQLYRERVPMLVPRLDGVRRWLRDEAAVPEVLPAEPAAPPAGIWMEFRGYLIGLVGLVALFASVWAMAGVVAR